jgi:hypothetical protein
MRRFIPRFFFGLIVAVLAAAPSLSAQQDSFRWMDFHSAKDQSVIVWVTRALEAEKWTAIREIGVEYDAALVVTTLRTSPQSPANADTFDVWSVSLTNHYVTPLLKGVNLRWLDGMILAEGKPQEPAALYDNCSECQADTYFTTFRYDVLQHAWTPRWLRGGQTVPVWSANAPAGVDWTQVDAGMAEPTGREFVGAWNHFDYGNLKPSEDYVYRYDVDPFSGLDRTQLLTGKDAEEMKLRLCSDQGAVPGLARGQDSPLCQLMVGKQPHSQRRPVTTPPANNHGQSVPPGARR